MLLLQSTAVSQATPWDTFKQKAKSATSNLTKKVGNAFESVTNKVLSFDKAKLFNTVQNKMASAGDRVRKIANCMMATGKECNVADRVILVATASFIFVSLMVLAGSSIGVAARAKIVEEAKKDQDQQVKGWGPKQMAQRLSNMFSDGRNKFASLKDGIIKGQLTTSQRNFMIGLGASILGATLVLAAVLTGLAVYSKNQETKEAARIAAEQRAEDERIRLGELEIAKRQADIEQTEEDILNIGVADDPSQVRLKGAGKELIFDTNLGDDVPQNKFTAFFDSKFKLAKDNAKQLKNAIAETISKGKNKLFKSAEQAGNFFLEKIGLADLKSDLSDFSIKDMVQKLLGIDLGNFFTGMRQVVSQVDDLKTQLNLALSKTKDINTLEKQFDDLKNYLQGVIKGPIEYLKTAKDKHQILFAVALPKLFKPASLAIPFNQYIKLNSSQKENFILEKMPEEEYKKLQKKEQEKYNQLYKKQEESWKITKKIRSNLREILNIYPNIVDIVNNKLNLPLIGQVVEKIINATIGGALSVAILTNKVGGKLGKIISANEMEPLLREMKDHTASLAENIKNALSNRIFLVEKPTTKDTLKALIKNLFSNGISTAKVFFSQVKPILDRIEKVKPQIDIIKKRLDKYVELISDSLETIKAAARDVKQNPLKAIPRFPSLLKNKVAMMAGITKGILTSTIKDAIRFLQDLDINVMIPHAINAFDEFNKLLSVKVNGVKTSIINSLFTDEIKKIIINNYVNINEVVKKMNEIINKTPEIAAPAA